MSLRRNPRKWQWYDVVFLLPSVILAGIGVSAHKPGFTFAALIMALSGMPFYIADVVRMRQR